MKEKRRRDVDKYLLLLGNYSIRSTDPVAVQHLSSSSSPSSTPSICVIRSENMKRGGGEKRRSRREEAGRTRMRLRKGSNLVMLKTSIHVSNMLLLIHSFVCCITHLSIEGGR